MRPCASCGVHVRVFDQACPACGAGAPAARRLPSAAAALLGLTMGCVAPTTDGSTSTTGETGTLPQPEYGVTITDTTDTGTYVTQPDYGTFPTDSGESGDTGAASTHSGHSGVR